MINSLKLILQVFFIFLISTFVNTKLVNAQLIAEEFFGDPEYSADYDYMKHYTKCSVYDPYEPFNRKIFFFNGVLDTFVLRPIAKGYIKFTNDYTKERVSSFMDNVNTPIYAINHSLQGNKKSGFKTFWRFFINTTLGLGGLFDIASKFEIKREPQTFSNSLAYYGVGPGPYIVIPFLGGMEVRDISDIMTSGFNPIKYSLHDDAERTITIVSFIDNRAAIMPFTDHVMKNSLDPYISIRDAIHAKLEKNIRYPKNFRCYTEVN